MHQGYIMIVDVVVSNPHLEGEFDGDSEDSTRNNLHVLDYWRIPCVGLGEVGDKRRHTPRAIVHVADEEGGEG